jgi:hypothetical protein
MKKYRIIEIKEPIIERISEVNSLPYVREIGYEVQYRVEELKEIKLFPWGKREEWVDMQVYYDKMKDAEFFIKFLQTELVRTIIKEY